MLTPVLHYSVKGDMIIAGAGLSAHVFFKLKMGKVILIDFHYEFIYGVWFECLGHVLIMA
jgi:hypothetical protein